jgi:hypothetical protein
MGSENCLLVCRKAGSDRNRIQNPPKEAEVAIDVRAARIPDRDALLAQLRDHGLEAEPHGELEIVVEADDNDGAVFREVESLILSIGAPFVPIKHDAVIYVRPPVG